MVSAVLSALSQLGGCKMKDLCARGRRVMKKNETFFQPTAFICSSSAGALVLYYYILLLVSQKSERIE